MSFLWSCLGVFVGVVFTSYMYERIEEYAVQVEAEDFRSKFCLEVVRAKLATKCYTQSLSVNPESK